MKRKINEDILKRIVRNVTRKALNEDNYPKPSYPSERGNWYEGEEIANEIEGFGKSLNLDCESTIISANIIPTNEKKLEIEVDVQGKERFGYFTIDELRNYIRFIEYIKKGGNNNKWSFNDMSHIGTEGKGELIYTVFVTANKRF